MAPILYINILRIFVTQLWCCTVINHDETLQQITIYRHMSEHRC